jgi:hypothetical protein
MPAGHATDLLNDNEDISIEGRTLHVAQVPPFWGRILKISK